jgi:transcriptional regulator NrdR family protein
MTCPECGGKVRVLENFDTSDNEIYRRRRCTECSHIFYTVEYEVEHTKQLTIDINASPRRDKRRACDKKRADMRKLKIKAYGVVCPNCSDYICDGLDENCPKIQRWVEKQMKKEK